MIAKIFSVTCLVFLLVAPVAAESYQIRVAYNTNLRASHSLDSAVLASARAGATLQVVGSFNRWLKINRNGETVWLADWVSYTRLDQGPAAASPASDIDNCCFVDRQCQTDQQWTDGYWAYQRNECPAQPTPVAQSSVSQSPVPAIAEAPHRIRNSQGREIPIYGNDEFRLQIARGFYYLRDKVPQWWPYLSIIDDVKFTAERCSGGYACAGWPYKVVYFASDVGGDEIRSIAATLIHEACHLYQWQEGRGDNYDWSLEWEDRPHEIECVNKEKEAGF